MLFNLKSAIILALVASISAAPTPFEEDASSLEIRAKGKPIKDVSCNGKKFTRAQIVAAKAAATTRHGKYPERYGNRERLFASAKPLFEFPLTDVPYTTGEPGAYRILFLEDYSYQGAIYHVGLSGGFKRCA